MSRHGRAKDQDKHTKNGPGKVPEMNGSRGASRANGATGANGDANGATGANGAKRWRLSPADAHEWVSFEDPTEARTWRFDVTFLLSHWECIYGKGCQGVLTAPAPELVQGCCSYGAHMTGDDDVARVKAAAKTLTNDQWQFAEQGRRGGVARRRQRGRQRHEVGGRRLHFPQSTRVPRRPWLRSAPSRPRAR